jgi:DNA-binding YbaB/EbfC family protein
MKKFYNVIKQAQEIQEKMKKTQEELAGRELEVTSGGGVVKVVMTGNKKLVSIEIDREVVDPDDVEMLQDLILSAVNGSLEKVDNLLKEEMAKVTGGLPLPDIF